MPLVPEDDTGLPDADSYVSVEYLEAYLEKYALEGPTGDEAEVYLRKATRALDLLYPFLGTSAVAGQALFFPIQDDLGLPVPVSNRVKDAVCELAILIFNGFDPLAPLDDTNDLISLTESVEGAVSVTKKWASPRQGAQLAQLRGIDTLLWGLYYYPGVTNDWYVLEVS